MRLLARALLHGRGVAGGIVGRHRFGDAAGEVLGRRPRASGCDRHHDVQALAAGRLEERRRGPGRLRRWRTSRAALTMSFHPVPGPGSRSKTRRSQRLQAVGGRAARMDFQHAGLHQRDQPVEIVDGDDVSPSGSLDEAQPLAVDAGARMLLEEALRRSHLPGQRTSASGRPTMCGLIQSQTPT